VILSVFKKKKKKEEREKRRETKRKGERRARTLYFEFSAIAVVRPFGTQHLQPADGLSHILSAYPSGGGKKRRERERKEGKKKGEREPDAGPLLHSYPPSAHARETCLIKNGEKGKKKGKKGKKGEGKKGGDG